MRTPRAGLALVVTTGEKRRADTRRSETRRLWSGAESGVDLRDSRIQRYRAHHCVIWCAAGRCWIRDLGSMNHTRVNNHSARLAGLFGDVAVVVGQTALTLALNAFAARVPHDAPRTR